MKFRPRKIFSSAASILFRFAVGFALFSFTLVLLFRFVHPPLSMFMVDQKIASMAGSGNGFHIRYQWVDLKDISPFMPLAVMASEDQGFSRHFGFDFSAIFKAIKNNIGHPRHIRGASTLSQQTAKNLFLWPERSYLRKGLEAWFTVLIELFWPKKRIIEVYLNIAEFGEGIYGVSAASQSFFNRPPKKMTPIQASLLAAVLPSPRKYNAGEPSPFVYERSEWIEEQMEQMGGLPAVEEFIGK